MLGDLGIRGWLFRALLLVLMLACMFAMGGLVAVGKWGWAAAASAAFLVLAWIRHGR